MSLVPRTVGESLTKIRWFPTPPPDPFGQSYFRTRTTRDISRGVIVPDSEPNLEQILAQVKGSRRAFLRTSTLGALAAGTLIGCRPDSQASAQQSIPKDSNQSGGTTAPHPAAISAAAKAEEMDRMHEAGIKAFPAKTEGKGNVLLPPRIENGVKHYDLVCSSLQWETEVGKRVTAWAYNGQVPGPQI